MPFLFLTYQYLVLYFFYKYMVLLTKITYFFNLVKNEINFMVNILCLKIIMKQQEKLNH